MSLLLLILSIYVEALTVSYLPKTGTPPPRREMSGLAYDSTKNKVYIYGGRSEIIHDDFWEFDLATNTWEEIHSPSVMKPGEKSGAYITVLEESRQILLFGGNGESGPISDVWLYDLDGEIVIFTQWQLAATKGKAPPRAYSQCVCDFIHEGKHYIAVYGGIGRTSQFKSLYILDLEELAWIHLSDSELGPLVSGEKMDYYKGSLYIYNRELLYIYDLNTNEWTSRMAMGKEYTTLIDYAQCIYDDVLYLIMGWDDIIASASRKIFRINLSNDSYQSEEISISNEGNAEWLFGYDCNDSLVYMFGGGSVDDGYFNQLSILDLSKKELEIQYLNEAMNVPTARRGHAMEAYDDKLYIFGGIDDMWFYDINEEDWSPVSFKSSVVPSPRSDFAHARYQDDFIIFGGKGDTELYNDIYRYSTRNRDWKMIAPETTNMPPARRAACMAAGDDFILIYGGIEASGYSNELWKFEWGTLSYTLIDSSNSPPKSAFSQCYLETNSDNQLIFKVLMGETEGGSPIEYLYEYNMQTDIWVQIRQPYSGTLASNSKSAIFMINKTIINAGGAIWNYSSNSRIIAFSLETGYYYILGYLPSNTYYGASVYYKDKIYIHGGGYSFGNLPLGRIVKNSLLVITLNEECQDYGPFCKPECSKGSFHIDEGCQLCPKGSYSDEFGSNSCELCRAGYFSEIIGAETSKACKPCLYGYFNTQEGESMCMKCPAGSICSLDEAKPDQSPTMLSYSSIQPDLLDYKTETVEDNSTRFYIFISLALIICLAILMNFPKTRNFIKNNDIFSLKHNYEEDQPIYIRKTVIGGLFTTAFYFAALAIIFNLLLSYLLDNIRETKALVPLAALEQQHNSFTSEKLSFKFEFKSYAGQCELDEGICTGDLSINLENVEGVRENLICRMIQSKCVITFDIRNFELVDNGKVGLKLSQPESLCSGISLEIKTSSSIPDEISSISDFILSDDEYFFIGPIPTAFSYLMTPSLFKTDSNIWEDDQTGYHISVQKYPTKGSQANISDIQYSKFLMVDAILYKNWAVLYTQRLQVQPIGILLSNLSGSICGILGILGFLMSLFERNYIKYTMKRRYEHNLNKIQEKREAILDKNFSYGVLASNQNDPKAVISPSGRLRLGYDNYESSGLLPVSTPVGLLTA